MIHLRLAGVEVDCITGPGRSGAIASAYASYILHRPFIPYGSPIPSKFKRLLIIDTARYSGNTLRSAMAKYAYVEKVVGLAVYEEPPRVRFWYEEQEDVWEDTLSAWQGSMDY